MLVHVLLFNVGQDDEGIHSLEIKEKTVVLMFEEEDDAQRYCGLLEAQDFPKPEVERVDRSEIEAFCNQSGYESRFVKSGFIPSSQEERLMITPPQTNLDMTSWDVDNINRMDNSKSKQEKDDNDELESIRKSLEDLL